MKDKTQPHIYCEKELYNEYKSLVKSISRNLIKYNELVFENAVRREIEAIKKLKEQRENESNQLASNLDIC